MIEDPDKFAEVIESIIKCNIDILLNSICSRLNKEFGLDCKSNSLHDTIMELKER